MKKCKFLVAVVLICAICLSLCACGVSKEDVVGVWSGSYTYKGNQFSHSFVLSDNGKYTKITLKNGKVSKSESGTYEIKGKKVLLHDSSSTGGTTTYKYQKDTLVNNDHIYTKK